MSARDSPRLSQLAAEHEILPPHRHLREPPLQRAKRGEKTGEEEKELGPQHLEAVGTEQAARLAGPHEDGVGVERHPRHRVAGAGIPGIVLEEGEDPPGPEVGQDHPDGLVPLVRRDVVEDPVAEGEIDVAEGLAVGRVEAGGVAAPERAGALQRAKRGIESKEFADLEDLEDVGNGRSRAASEVERLGRLPPLPEESAEMDEPPPGEVVLAFAAEPDALVEGLVVALGEIVEGRLARLRAPLFRCFLHRVNESTRPAALPREKPNLLQEGGVLVALVALAAAFQLAAGAWRSDFGGHADEGAHVVTSLMVRDYLAGGWLETPHPVRYAEAYYERFPKVAIGHYPPLFYAVAALPLLPVREGGTLLATMALLAGGVGWTTWRLARNALGGGAGGAFCLAAAAVLLPLVRTYTAIVMSDLLLILLCLLAALAFARYLRHGRLRDSLCFGGLAAAAILTKGSGLALALLPPLAIAISGRWGSLRDPRLWASATPPLLFALPWMGFTSGITAEGMAEASPTDYFREALPFYLRGLGAELGWIAVAFAVAAPVLAGVRKQGKTAADPMPPELAVAFSLPVAVLFLASAVPSGLDHRYLLPLVPAVLVAAAWAVRSALPSRIRLARWPLPLFSVLVLASVWRPVEKRYTGAADAVREVVETGGAAEAQVVLLVSDATGEGALTAAACLSEKESLRILRGSKVLATSDWLGRSYEMAFSDASSLAGLLSSEGVDAAIVEQPPSDRPAPPHWTETHRLLSVATDFPARALPAVASLRKRGGASAFTVYRLAPLPPPAGGTAPPPRDAARAAPFR